MNNVKSKALVLASTLLLSQPLLAQSWFDKAKELFQGAQENATADQVAALTNNDITAGLKDALKVGTSKVVDQLGKEGGFGLDDAIRIKLPEELHTAKKWLSRIGMEGSLVDLENRMNQAAEAATPQAKALFMGAIAEMSIDDAKAIYSGPNDAATQYFREKMGGPLGELIRPVVDKSLAEAGAVKTFNDIMSKYKDIPFVPDVNADLSDHTVNKGLDGIFHYLAEEEAAIRQDPAARTTELLKKVFSK